MSEWNYFVTAQRATAVLNAVGPLRLFSAQASEIVVARNKYLEVLRPELQSGAFQLASVCEMPINGRIAALKALSLANRDALIICTEKRQMLLITWNDNSAEVRTVTHAVGSLSDTRRRLVDHPPLFTVDPQSRAFAAYVYEGMLQIVVLKHVTESEPTDTVNKPVDLSEERCIFAVPMQEARVLQLAILRSQVDDAVLLPLAVLHCDDKDQRYISMWLIDLEARTLRPMTDTGERSGHRASGQSDDSMASTAPNMSVAHPGAMMLAEVPSPLRGIMVVGGGTIAYHRDSGRCVASTSGGPIEVTTMSKYGDDQFSWLVGGSDGSLWQLRMTGNSLTAKHLGITSIARALVCLHGGHAFIGSAVSDSQLVRLSEHQEGLHGKSFIVEQTWMNLGPIIDFCMVDVDGQGHHQVATCSGYGRDGSLKLVRLGTGVNEVGALDDVGVVLGLWTVGGGSFPAAVVLGFLIDTRVLVLDPFRSELTELHAPGLVQGEETLLCCGCEGPWALQVTRSGVQAVTLDAWQLATCWKPLEGHRIQIAAPCRGGVLFGCGSDEIFLLEIACQSCDGKSDPTLRIITSWVLGGEASCLQCREGLFAAGLWTQELRVMGLPAAPGSPARSNVCLSEPLPRETIPRSIAFANLGGKMHLLVGMGDGRLISFLVDPQTAALSQRKAVCVGSQPLRLVPLRSMESGETEHVFMTGDRPTVVHAHGTASGRLLYGSVNLRHVAHAAPLDCAVAPFCNCLALVADKRLVIGSLDSIQRVHVKTVPLGESPQRIAHLRQTNMLAVGCHPLCMDEVLDEISVGNSSSSSSTAPAKRKPNLPVAQDRRLQANIHFIHGQTLDVQHVLSLNMNEHIGCMCAVRFEGCPSEYLAVGTAFVVPDEPEPSRGRVLLCSEASSGSSGSGFRCTVVCQHEVTGAVYAMIPFKRMLLASVNNVVYLWQLGPGGGSLEVNCKLGDTRSIIALHLQAMGDSIVLGDLVQSASLVRYSREPSQLKELGRDACGAWLTSADMLSEDLVLCADDHHNIFVLAQRSGDTAQETLQVGGSAASASRRHARSEESERRLQRVAQVHLGEFVNKFRRAALIAPLTGAACDTLGGGSACDEYGVPLQQVVWASVDGAIGLIASLRSAEEFARLAVIQIAVSAQAEMVNGLPHCDWRDCWSESDGLSPHKGFIDGDILEMFLELPQSAQQAVVNRVKASGFSVENVEQLLREVEELAQLH